MWNYSYSLGSCRKKRQVFNEGLPAKGILNKQMPHLAASPADLPEIYTAIIYSPLHKLHFIIFQVGNAKESDSGHHLQVANRTSMRQAPKGTAWPAGWSWAGLLQKLRAFRQG